MRSVFAKSTNRAPIFHTRLTQQDTHDRKSKEISKAHEKRTRNRRRLIAVFRCLNYFHHPKAASLCVPPPISINDFLRMSQPCPFDCTSIGPGIVRYTKAGKVASSGSSARAPSVIEVAGHWSLVAGRWPLAAGRWPLFGGCCLAPPDQ